jgi:uncharacterized membrane protein YdfJ with MMPL/SSD domain
MVIAVVLLAGLALPVLDFRTGFAGTAQMPPGETTDAYRAIERDFRAGVLAPVGIVFQGEHTEEMDAALEALRAGVEATGEFALFSQPVQWDGAQQLAVMEGA